MQVKWKKNTPAKVAYVEAVMTEVPCQRRPMFGGLAYFVNGNMFAGLHQDLFFLRLPEADRRALGTRGGKPLEPMPGRPMREYVVLPETLLKRRPALTKWLAQAHDYAKGLPAKPKK
jgi:TfoX/Sxy family transcriptional regulator of competence genes